MKLEEAQMRFNNLVDIRFEDLFRDLVPSSGMDIFIRNKGKSGQLLELALGMNNSNRTLDFEDGELKSNKCSSSGKPKQTVFIMQISGMIDELIRERPFEETRLYEKIHNILYVPVCKDGNPRDWKFLPCIHVDLEAPCYRELKDIWSDDYYSICRQLKNHIENSQDGFIHTSNGEHLQVRSKDSRPYHPIYSEFYRRDVSNKNHAFYFKKQFVYDIQRLSH